MEDVMKPVLCGFWQKSNKWLKTGWLITAGLSALYFGTMQPNQGYVGVASETDTSLSGAQWDPVSMWRESHSHGGGGKLANFALGKPGFLWLAAINCARSGQLGAST
jgi:hypothetical protein